MNAKIVAAALSIVFAGHVAAEDQRCDMLENDIARLSCFDDAAKAEVAKAKPPSWKIRTETDQITDATRTIISVQSMERPACAVGYQKIPELEVYCAEAVSTWMVRIRMPCTLARSDQEMYLITRFDKGEVMTSSFSRTGGGNDIQASSAASIEIVNRLVSAKTYLLRIEPYLDYPEVLAFPVGGLLPMLTESGTSCKLSE